MAQSYTAIRVTEDVKAKAAEAKQNGETWDEYVLRCTKHPPEVREFADTGVLVASVQDELDNLAFQGALTEQEADRLLNSVATIEERTNRLERMVEGLQR